MICYTCGFYDLDSGQCTCPSLDMWYACPIEAEKPENKKIWMELIRKSPERSQNE